MSTTASTVRKVLVIDVGGTHVKVMCTGQNSATKFDSGPELTPDMMVEGVKAATSGWEFDVITVGFPAPVLRDKILHEPVNLGEGWLRFDFAKAFGKPVRVINDAAMQALGSYEGGRMLFIGLGTGMGTAMIDDGFIVPLEVAHLPFRKATFEYYVGAKGLKRAGRERWEARVHKIATDLCAAMICEYVILGGGNSKLLKSLPACARLGNNANAFVGGFRLWDEGMAKA